MSSFDEREKSFEKKFAHDQELQFKVSARKNKYLGETWDSVRTPHRRRNHFIQAMRLCPTAMHL